MGYKTVMVSLALDRSNDACLAVAGDLAERFEARVVGIAASDFRPTLYFAEGDYAEKVLEEERAAIRKRLSELEIEFRTSVSKRAKSVEWRSAQTLPIPYVMQHARAADILVVGARAEAMVDPCVAADPSDLVMQAGRPLVVVPPTVQWLDLRSVLVAWKDVREARRAVFDALPIFAAAKDVTIAEIPEQNTERADALSHVEDVAGMAAWPRHCGEHCRSGSGDRSCRRRTARQDCRQCRRRRCDRRRLWSFALPRMDTPVSRVILRPNRPVCVSVSLGEPS